MTSSITSLRAHDSSRLDWDALQEELAALGRQECRELVSRLGVLLGHLLKWQLQPERRTRSLPAASPWTVPQALDPARCCDTRGDWSGLGL